MNKKMFGTYYTKKEQPMLDCNKP